MSSLFYQHVGNMFINMLSICYQNVYKCVNQNEISASVQVESGSNNVLGLIGVVGAALLGHLSCRRRSSNLWQIPHLM
jgi:hypothetical protein